MNPKIFGDVDDDIVDFSSTTTFENTNQGAAFEVVDPFSETKIVDYSESSLEDSSYDYSSSYFSEDSSFFSEDSSLMNFESIDYGTNDRFLKTD